MLIKGEWVVTGNKYPEKNAHNARLQVIFL